MPDDNPIFRKVALERLSSPEQLDRLLEITSPKGWLALLAVAGVLVVALLWAFLGRVHTTVHGRGILIQGGNVYDVVTSGQGVVTQILVQSGQTIHENQAVAVISQPQLELRIDNTVSLLNQLQEQDRELSTRESETLLIEIGSLNQEFTNLLSSIQTYGEMISKLQRKQSNQRQALTNQLIVESTLLSTELETFSAEQQQRQAEQRLSQIEVLQTSRPMEIKQAQTARQQRIEEISHELSLLQQQLALTSQVRSSYEGTVLEVVVDPGSFVVAGGRILSLETPQQLQAVMFTPPDQGKRVKTNFQVRLSPATVKKEVAGFMKGTVVRVSPYPSTPERLMRVLRNEGLISQLSGYGAPIEVLVTLNTNQAGQYEWSSSREELPEITSGTLCTAAIVVETNKPITLLLPAFRKGLGM